MKNMRLITILMCIVFSFSGCSGTGKSADNSMESTGSSDGSSTGPVNVKVNESLKDYAGADYNFDTDYQSYFSLPQIAKAEKGYYFWEAGSGRLSYYDASSNQCVPLCNKADCTHNDEDCNAFFNANSLEDKDIYIREYLQYYDGSIFIAGYDPEGYVNLYKVAADGSSCDRYMCLFKQNMSSISGDTPITSFTNPDICIHRGYVYFINNMESVPKLYRMKLGAKKAEVVYENTGIRPSTYRIKAYGDQIYFQSGNFTDETCIDIEGGIYSYDIQTKKVSMYKKSAISNYLFYKDELYYSTAEGIYHYTKETDMDTKVLDTENSNADFFILDEETVAYIDEDSDMIVCNLEKEQKHTIKGDKIVIYLFGDGTIFFADGIEGEAENLYAIKFDEIGKASDWTNIMDMD